MFIGFDPEETFQSLAIHSLDDAILFKCKAILINIATTNGIVMSSSSSLTSTNAEEADKRKNVYY
jgi:hypothetical protein